MTFENRYALLYFSFFFFFWSLGAALTFCKNICDFQQTHVCTVGGLLWEERNFVLKPNLKLTFRIKRSFDR